jgi:hypothetical protein
MAHISAHPVRSQIITIREGFITNFFANVGKEGKPKMTNLIPIQPAITAIFLLLPLL